MRKAAALLIFSFGFVSFGLAQTVVKTMETPEGYRQWPNHFEIKRQLGSNTVAFNFWLVSYKNTEESKFFSFLSINEKVVQTSFRKVRGHDVNYAQSLMLLDDGYHKIDSSVSAEDATKTRQLFEKNMKEKFGLEMDQVYDFLNSDQIVEAFRQMDRHLIQTEKPK